MTDAKTIVLVTTGQPSVNPRIAKEADALQTAGYNVTVLYCFWISWALAADEQFLKNVKWNYRLIGGSPFCNKAQYMYTKSRLKANRLLNEICGNQFLLAERSQARCYDELLKAAKSIKADWYIGHNIGTLPIIAKAAKYNSAKCGFDFEDYHREETRNMQPNELGRLIYLEQKYVSSLDYISTASPLISKKIKDNFPSYNKPLFTIMNCFSLRQQPVLKLKSAEDKTLKLFWFSQTIGINRGLEMLLKAMEELNDNSIHLTLAGRCNDDFKMYAREFKTLTGNLHFAGIVQPGELPQFAGNFDVGLALELTEPANRNICLTNKIFIYLLAGNAVLVSNTAMQAAFNKQFNIGELFCNNDISQLKEKIVFYQTIENLNSQKLHNYKLASVALNWEIESKKLLNIV